MPQNTARVEKSKEANEEIGYGINDSFKKINSDSEKGRGFRESRKNST